MKQAGPRAPSIIVVRSPDPDDLAFAEKLAEGDVFVLPGAIFEMPGYFRISLTATMEMIERALPVFEKAFVESAVVR